jgi:hypothetical protein
MSERAFPIMQIRTPEVHHNRTMEDILRELKRPKRLNDDAWLFVLNTNGTITPATDPDFPGASISGPDPFSPIFQGSWHNIGPPYPPLSAYRMHGRTYARGGITGGLPGSLVCTWPDHMRPIASARLVLPTDMVGSYSTFEIASDGTMTYVG